MFLMTYERYRFSTRKNVRQLGAMRGERTWCNCDGVQWLRLCKGDEENPDNLKDGDAAEPKKQQ